MSDIAVRVADPDLARQVYDVLAACRTQAAAEVGDHTRLLVTDRPDPGPGVPTVLVTTSDGPEVWRTAAAAGADQVVRLPDGAALLDRRVRQRRPAPAGRLIRVIGARGGCGATTLAVGLAAALAHDRSVALLDGDPVGGGLDTALGAEDVAGLRWSDVADLRTSVPPASLIPRLPSVAGIPVLSQGRAATPVAGAWPAVTATLTAGVEVVVADLPRYAAAPADAATADVLVVPHDVLALSCARQLIDSGIVGPDAVVAVRRIRGPVPATAVAESLPHRMLVDVPECAGVRAGTDFGDLLQAVAHRQYAAACRGILAAVAETRRG